MAKIWISFLLLLLNFPMAMAPEDCGECPHPLVEMKNLRIGEINTIASLFKQLANQFYGWEEGEVAPSEVILRGFNFLEFRKENPCADMYYLEKRWTGEKEAEIRHGASQGVAKYFIQSTLNMIKAQPGEMALVYRVRYDEKGNTISEQEDYVPKMGTVHVHHELTCLKNNETYDVGDVRLDWLPDPPSNEGHFRSEKGSDGIIVGLFSKGSIAGLPVILSKGDVGKTIRNKEIPSAFSLETEEGLYFSPSSPHYQLKIHNIRNLLGEPLPNKIFVAVRPKHGEISGGEKVQGWSVFPTEGAEIQSKVIYKVPECSRTTNEIIEMAAYCDWHAGEPAVGEPRTSQSFQIPRCFNLSLNIRNTDYMTSQYESTLSLGSVYKSQKKTTDMRTEISAFATFKKTPKMIIPVSKDRLLYIYEVDSWKQGPSNLFINTKEDKVEGSEFGVSYEFHESYYKHGSIVRLLPKGSQELKFLYDKKEDRIVSVEEMPASGTMISWHESRESKSYRPKDGWKTDTKTDTYTDPGDFIGRKMTEDQISGDGRTSLTGHAKKEERTSPKTEKIAGGYGSETMSGVTGKTMRWELRRQ